MLTALFAAAVQLPLSPPIYDPPAPPSGNLLVAWAPGAVTCDGAPQRALVMRRPLTGLTWGGVQLRPVVVRFTIDATGRTQNIKRDAEGYAFASDDLEPSLAATRFAPGAARTGCSVTYSLATTPLADAPVPDLMSYTIDPINGALPRAGWDRISGGASCAADPRPDPLLRGYPDFHDVPGTPGVRDWSMVGYDLDARGRPVGAHIVTGTGNAALDRAAVTAVAQSRFTGGARRGCLYPYWKNAAPLPAPAEVDLDSLRPAGSGCPTHGDWAQRPALLYPEPFRKRAIEGWAVIGFDVAPWGATGNVKVLAAEPAAGFGEAAANLIRGATKAPSPAGLVGCVEKVRFVMGTPKKPAPVDPDAPTPVY